MTIFETNFPDLWSRSPLKHHFRITKKPRHLAISSHAAIHFAAMESIPSKGRWKIEFECRTQGQIKSGIYFEAGDVLLSKITPSFQNGKQGIAVDIPTPFAFGSTELIPLQALDNTASNYFLFFLLLQQEIRDFLASRMEGSTGRKRVPEEAIRNLLIPVPPKHEQEKIAAVLWKVQQAIETQDRLIAATNDLKQAAMAHLFLHGLRGEPLKQTEIGLAPENWELVTVGEVAKVSAGGTPSRTNKAFWEGGEIPWVKTGEIDYRTIGDTEEKITKEALDNSAAKLLPAGTLLLAMYGQGVTRGKVAKLGIDAATNQACAAIHPIDDRTDTDFLYWMFAYGYERLRSLAHGGQQQNLNAALLRSFQFARPSLNEQREIARYLSIIDRKLAHHRQKRAALSDLFQTLLHKLMTAEIRVHELDIDTTEVAA